MSTDNTPQSSPEPVFETGADVQRGLEEPVDDGATGFAVENAIELKEVEGLSQGRIVLRRFVRHRGAMVSVVVLAAVVLLAATSIGWGPIPGWWQWSFRDITPVYNTAPLGGPTLGFYEGSFHFGPHPFGQDNIGRDVFAMVMRGTQQSLTVMAIIGASATLIGVLLGALSGFFRGWVDNVIMRFTDMIITIPVIMVGAILGVLVGGASAFTLAIAKAAAKEARKAAARASAKTGAVAR